MPTSSSGDQASSATEPVRIRVHALRAGTWPASPRPVTLGQDEIEQIARSYRPELYSAPVVLGHPHHDDPAWGEVLAAQADERGLWLGCAIRLELAQFVSDRSYRAVSVSLWTPGALGNP